MQRSSDYREVSDEEHIKRLGLILDMDEISRKGSLTPEEALLLKWYGIYKSRQAGDHMCRIVIPGGKISADQAIRVAELSQRYSNGLVNITTRQALQYHQLKIGTFAAMIRDLAEDDLSIFHGCGDVTRTVATCPLAETCTLRRVDVRPYAEDVARYLTSCRDLDDLPRKFKINFSGCGANCGQPFMNCLGFTAVSRSVNGTVEQGFNVVIGGGMGWKAFVAQELYSFIPLDMTRHVARAVAILFREHGDRFDRTRSRLKFVVDRMGIDACREIVAAALVSEGHAVDRLVHRPIDEVGPEWNERPLTDSYVSTDSGILRIRIPKGEIPSGHLRTIAELSEEFADQHVYTSNRQNIELHGISIDKKDILVDIIRLMGYETIGHYALRDIVSCVGTTFCPKAVTPTRALYDRLAELTADARFDAVADGVLINITGCPNSCSPWRIVDIGFRGKRIRGSEGGSFDGYDMLIGGDQQAHGLLLGEFLEADCVAATSIVLDTYAALRIGSETLRATVARVGIEPFIKAVKHG